MTKKKSKGGKVKATESAEDLIYVDPSRVRFQHSRIRPHFSGCGRSVAQTLDDLRRGEIQPTDIPPIQVIVGPDDEQGQWYFSLNNRRLWVFKRLREEGLLPNNQIAVRVRSPKSESERNRYTLENCALEAKLMREAQPPSTGSSIALATDGASSKTDALLLRSRKPKKESNKEAGDVAATICLDSISIEQDDDHDDDDDDADDDASSEDDSSVEGPVRSNPFSVLG